VLRRRRPEYGTWKLNETKSKPAPGAEKLTTVVYEAAGDQVKVTIDGTDASGKPIHNEWTGKFGRKGLCRTGDSTSDMRSYKKVDANTLKFTVKKATRQPSWAHCRSSRWQVPHGNSERN